MDRALLIICQILTPIAANLIYVMTSYRITRVLYSQVMAFVFVTVAVDRCFQYDFRLKKIASGFTVACFAIVSLGLIRTDNISCFKATLIQEEATQYFNTLITSIKNTEGYCDEYPVAYVNSNDKTDLALTEFEEFIGLPEDPNRDLPDYLNVFMWQRFMEIWCGYSPKTVLGNGYLNNPIVQEMPSYPDKGSICIIDEVGVVKF